MTIQWYPGHMAKAKKIIVEGLQVVDGILEVVDARLPWSSRNPDLQGLSVKPSIVVLTKADLADAAATKAWIEYWSGKGEKIAAVDLVKGTGLRRLRRSVRDAFPHLKRAPRLLVAGIPNVGKSTLINRLTRRRGAAVGAKPGMTRGKQWLSAPGMQLLDSPGILWPKFEDQETAKKLAAVASIRDEVFDAAEIAVWLLALLQKKYGGALQKRYGKLDYQNLLENIGEKRGCLLPGGIVDLNQAAAVVLKDFRAGKLGKVTLELPPDWEA